MIRTGPKLLRVLLGGVAASMLAVVPLNAATTADITITVTISNLSVSVADGAITFGAVSLGSDTVSAEKQVVTNNGNVSESYTLQLSGSDLLTVGETETAAAANTFVLQALFTGSAGAAPSSGNFGADAGTADDVVKASGTQSASASVYAWTGSTGNGSSVPAAGVRDLYFKYSAPTSDSVTAGAQEDLTVTVAASAS